MVKERTTKLLDKINLPKDVRKLEVSDLSLLSKELRDFIIESVAINGGHFAASLGVVELTVALHYVFNTPEDTLIWDVGHQAYGHKILTGRKDVFHTNRQLGGISGFPKMSESEYDSFGVGHSSTSISAALGMAEADKIKGNKKRNHIAVIGDGSLTGGMSFEALNNAGVSNANLLVVLNDNRIAIDPNVGALKDFLVSATASVSYNKFRDNIWKLLGKTKKYGPNAQSFASKIEHSTKTFFFKQSNLFEALKFRYFGPIDGHDVEKTVKILQQLKHIEGPKILHIITTKGKGYKYAEEDQTRFHAPGLFDVKTGKSLKKTNGNEAPKYQDVFGKTLVELARKNKNIIGVTPAMPTGSSMTYMLKEFPDRSFDVGIAEQHAVTFSAGLATQGLKPFCAIYSTFLQRAYDQLIHDVCIQKLPVVFCIDRAGLVGDDGATHHGAFDISYLQSIPNLVIASPLNEIELRNMMFTAQNHDMPFAIRYPRGQGVTKDWKKPMKKLQIGKGQMINDGDDIAILSIGHVGNNVIEAVNKLKKENISVAHYDMRFVKPIDEELLHKIAKKHNKIITVENGSLSGGFGSTVLEFLSNNNYTTKVKRLGIPDKFIDHGTIPELQNICGFNTKGIIDSVKEIIKIK
ncbi:MAG: 1-deoxy-D-xylulose-5-phosphate synthase [Bacteroidota bacterium]|nr:1-deoxy-D-xylulose-5-phosphate synthase [Bacteroidota bacterium]